jgi:hypothetical protein
MLLTKVRKRLRGYKTIVFNAVIGTSASVGVFFEEVKELDLTPWLGQYASKILVAIAVAGIILRLTTSSPALGRRARRRRDEPTGYEHLDDEDEDDDGSRRDNADARKARRKGRSNS